MGIFQSPEFREGPIKFYNNSSQSVILSGEWSMVRTLNPGCSIGVHDPEIIDVNLNQPPAPSEKPNIMIAPPGINIGLMKGALEGMIENELIVKVKYDNRSKISGVFISDAP